MCRLVAVVILCLAFVQVARADTGGIGIVMAPESNIWTCTGDTPDAAFSCARKKCKDSGEIDCYRVAWCYPSGWSVLYSMRAGDFHTPGGFCGAPTRAAALNTLKQWCKAQDYVTSCYAYMLLTPDGGEEEVDKEFTFKR